MKIPAIQALAKQTLLFTFAYAIAMGSVATALPFIFAASAGAVSGSQLIYDALPSIDPQTSYPAHGYQVNETSQLADSVNLGGSNRRLETVTVTLNSGAKFSEYSTNPAYSANSTSWSQEVTVNVYSSSLDANGVPDTLLATEVQPFNIPWSPEAAVGGIATNVTLNFTDIYVQLPENVIVGVAFNTQNYGAVPTGVPGPYNSLGVATPNNQPSTIGTDADIDGVFLDSTLGVRLAGLKADSSRAPNGTLALRVTATELTPVTTGPTNPGDTTSGDGLAPAAEPDNASVLAAVSPMVPSITNPSFFAGIPIGNSQLDDDLDNDAIKNNSTNTVTTTAAAAVDSEANQGKFLGIGWYWWLLGIAALASVAWWVSSAARNRQAE